LKFETAGFLKTLATIHESMQCYIPGDSNLDAVMMMAVSVKVLAPEI
jgi:hypothetical protein